jgi:ATP-dependent helicase/nuclease subunit A
MGAKFEPTEEQRAAIVTPGNLLIRAGAGSGKTEVLARRFVALVAGDIAGRDPVSPERMAAIVFGNLAAVELRERIGATLDERIATAADPQQRDGLRRARRMLPLARISTIHAFCARILRENPLAAGLDPGFVELDEFESDAFLAREARQKLIELVRADDPGARYLVGTYRLDGTERSEGAVDLVLAIAAQIARLGKSPEWLVERAKAFGENEARLRSDLAKIADNAIRLIEDLLNQAVGGAAGERIAESKMRWTSAKRAIKHIARGAGEAEWDTLMSFADGLPEARNKTLKDTVKAINSILPKNSKLKGELPSAWGTLRSLALIREVAPTAAAVAQALIDARRRERVVTFDDLLILARQLLRERADIADRYRAELEALLVDEYQDVDPLQDDIVETLAAPAAGGAAPELFIVGDEKQSIYGFRGADVTVINRQRAASPQTLPMRGNRRSTPAILGFVNGVGAYATKPPDGGGDFPVADRSWWIEWTAEHDLKALRTDEFNPPVEMIVTTGGRTDEEAGAPRSSRYREAAAIAARIHEIIAAREPVFDEEAGAPRPSRYGDIAILLRAFGDVALYENALARAGIPSYTVQGRGFFARAEVRDLTELLAAIDDPDNSLALAAALRSPLFGMSDRCLFELANRSDGPVSSLAARFSAPAPPAIDGPAEDAACAEAAWKILKELRDLRGRAPLAALLERALALTDFEAVLLGLDERGRQRVANVRKLIELARRFESSDIFSLRDLVATMRRLAQDREREAQSQILGADQNVVRLMTVHQAKGLEFPIAIVADLARRPPNDRDICAVSPEHGLMLPATYGAGHFSLPHRELDAHRKILGDRAAAERARLLYVAMTRARDRLILSEGALNSQTPKAAWARTIRAFLLERKIDVAAFADSGEPAREFSAGGFAIVLRRPNTALAAAQNEAAPELTAARADLVRTGRARRDFAAQGGGDLIVDPSSLEDFARCPRQYYFRRKLKLPEASIATRAAAGGAPDAAALGIVVHKILETLDFGAAADAIERKAAEIAAAHDIPSDTQREILRDLRRYLATASARPPERARQEREAPFFMCVAAGDPAIYLRGRIDLLIVDGRRAIVRDYKYSLPSEDGDAAAYALAGQCYALATSAAYPDCEITAEVVYLRGGVRRVELDLPESGEIRQRVTTLGRKLAAAARAGEWPKTPADARECRRLGCGYVTRCWGGD